jgi:hypothetical protein
MDSTKKVNGVRLLIYASVVMLSGVLALQHADLLGRTLASALLPSDTAATPEVVTAEATLIAPVRPAAFSSTLYADNQIDFERLTPLSPGLIDNETLWLARCIYSESKRQKEQELIAWVVRNRVETAYRGKRNYRDAVLDPFQFSAFNPGTRTRDFYSSLGPRSRYPGWQSALRIAYEVRLAEAKFRPFPHKTRHFYSEQSMLAGVPEPNWAGEFRPVLPEREHHVDPRRFRFYQGIR